MQGLRQRRLFRVAAAYAVGAWVLLQVLDVLGEPLQLPPIVFQATLILLALGLPVTLLLAWMLNIAPPGQASQDQSANEESRVSPRHNIVETSLLALLAVGMVWLIAKDLASDVGASSTGELPVVVLMDTYAPRGVYDEQTVLRSNTNADVLSTQLADLPAILQKEAVGAIWNRESQIIRQKPSVIVIHRSAFFHSMNLELGFGYPDEPDTWDEEKMARLYEIADNKLVAFLGYVSTALPEARFVIYSRGTGGGWADPDYRSAWAQAAGNRFASLEGRIAAMAVPGGTSEGSFYRQDALDAVRGLIVEALETQMD